MKREKRFTVNKKMKDWIECISYGCIGMFSAMLFVFGVMFPKYMFVEEAFGNAEELREEEAIMSVEQLRAKGIKVTCLSYECLKEIIDGWD